MAASLSCAATRRWLCSCRLTRRYELLWTCRRFAPRNVAADSTLPLLVGVGIDLGEAVPVEDGFRGAALNTAARLCSQAAAGQVLVTLAVADRAGEISGVALCVCRKLRAEGFRGAGGADRRRCGSAPSRARWCRTGSSRAAADRARARLAAGRERAGARLAPRDVAPGLSWKRPSRRRLGRCPDREVEARRRACRLRRLERRLSPYAGAGGTAAVLAASAVREAVDAPGPRSWCWTTST